MTPQFSETKRKRSLKLHEKAQKPAVVMMLLLYYDKFWINQVIRYRCALDKNCRNS